MPSNLLIDDSTCPEGCYNQIQLACPRCPQGYPSSVYVDMVGPMAQFVGNQLQMPFAGSSNLCKWSCPTADVQIDANNTMTLTIDDGNGHSAVYSAFAFGINCYNVRRVDRKTFSGQKVDWPASLYVRPSRNFAQSALPLCKSVNSGCQFQGTPCWDPKLFNVPAHLTFGAMFQAPPPVYPEFTETYYFYNEYYKDRYGLSFDMSQYNCDCYSNFTIPMTPFYDVGNSAFGWTGSFTTCSKIPPYVYAIGGQFGPPTYSFTYTPGATMVGAMMGETYTNVISIAVPCQFLGVPDKQYPYGYPAADGCYACASQFVEGYFVPIQPPDSPRNSDRYFNSVLLFVSDLVTSYSPLNISFSAGLGVGPFCTATSMVLTA